MSLLGRAGGVLLVLPLLASAALAEDGKPEWTTFQSEKWQFIAKFPSEVQIDKRPSATHFHAAIPGTDTDFRIGATEVPPENVPEGADAQREFLRGIRDKSVENLKGEIANPRDLTIAGQPGIAFELRIELGETKAEYSCRYLIHDRNFFQVMTGRPLDQDISAAADVFFKSFRLVPTNAK
jgi:hypothetical protein